MPDIEIAVEVITDTDAAYLITDGNVECWIPKSVVKDYSEENGQIRTIFISEWFAEKKGLI